MLGLPSWNQDYILIIFINGERTMTKQSQNKKTKTMHCSFCKGTKSDVGNLVSGKNGDGSICGDCIQKVQSAFANFKRESNKTDKKLPLPIEIKKFLDGYVIGQDSTKKSLAVAVYNHYLRINGVRVDADVSLSKSNILLIGDTGCGKTLLAQTLSKVLDVPLVISDATSLSKVGYVGDDVESLIAKLLVQTEGDVAKAEKGIIYLDEIDKISRAGGEQSMALDVGGEGVQQSLLKIIEGTEVYISTSKGRGVKVDTSNILFICGGAFDGLNKQIAKRLNKSSIGFNQKDAEKVFDRKRENYMSEVTTEDLVKYGMLPEILGRLPIVTALHPLEVNDLKRVFYETKNSLAKQFTETFAMQGVKLSFTENFVTQIAEKAIAQKTGARGLRTLLEDEMLEYMFDIPSRKNVESLTLDVDISNGGKVVGEITKRKRQVKTDKQEKKVSKKVQTKKTVAKKKVKKATKSVS